MHFVLAIDTDNHAFGEGDDLVRNQEIARLLRYAADSVSGDVVKAILRDANGNRVGLFSLEV